MLLRPNSTVTLQSINQWICDVGGLLPALGIIAEGVAQRLPGIEIVIPGGTIRKAIQIFKIIEAGVNLIEQSREAAEEAAKEKKADCDPNCVARAGEAKPQDLINGYGPHRELPIYGLSVQYRPGVLLKDLASVGFPNKVISYARDTEIVAAGAALGYIIAMPPTPGFGAYHATLTPTKDGVNPQSLPNDLALALSIAFAKKMDNPNRVERR
jgi:hypothetical protein